MAHNIIKTTFDLIRWAKNEEELCAKYQNEIEIQNLFNPDGTERYKKYNWLWGALLHVYLGANLAVGEDFEDQGDLKLINVMTEESNYNTISAISSDIPIINGLYQPQLAVPFRTSLLKQKCNIIVALCLCFHENVGGIMLPRMYILDALIIESPKEYRSRCENFYDWCVPRIKHPQHIVQREHLPEFYCKWNQFQLSLHGQNKNFLSQKHNIMFRDSRVITDLQKSSFKLLHKHKQPVVIPPVLKKMDFQIKENEFLKGFSYSPETKVRKMYL